MGAMKKLFNILALTVCVLSGYISYAQSSMTVNGTVKDASGQPIIGAVVMVDGFKSAGAVTDLDGKYKVVIPAAAGEKASLTFSYLSYVSQTIKVNGRNVIDVILEEDAELLEEVVVVGYGAMRRSDLTGSVTSVKIDEEDAGKASTLDELIKGKAAGVQVLSSNASPDASVSVRVRGITSLNGSNEPLYVVDGVIMSVPASATMFTAGLGTGGSDEAVNTMMGINPQDIASMEILKDASATAIYGSAGANGVVLITTKNANRDRPTIRFNAGVDMSQMYKHIDMLDLDEYVTFIEAMGGQGANRTLKRIYAGYVDPENRGTLNVDPVDWQDFMTRSAISQRYYLSISGRPKTISYNFSVGYQKKDGIVKQTGAEQYTIRLNVTKEISKKFKVGTKLNLAHVSSSMTQGMSTTRLDAASSMMRSMLVSRPFMGLGGELEDDDEDDYDEFRSTPARWLGDFNSLRKEYRVTPHVFAEWKIAKWLVFKSAFGGDYRLQERTKWKGWSINNGTDGSVSAVSSSNTYRWNWDNTLNFNKKIRKHRINATLGMATSLSKNSIDVIEGWNIPEYKAQHHNINAAVNTRMAYTESAVSENSFFARAMYNYADRYLLTATYRIDGSSKFLKANRYSVFPSFAFAWRLSEEPWFKADWVSMAKLRVGWGQVGNSGVSAYQVYSTYSTNHYPDHADGNDAEYVVGFIPNNIANPDLKWETTRQWNAGLDLGFWDGRLALTLDLYDKDTYDLLQKKTVTTSSGFSSVWVNDGRIRNRGIELAVEATPLIIGDFEWNISGNISFNRNSITSLGASGTGGELYLSPENKQNCSYYYGKKIGSSNYLNSVVNIFIEGQPIGLFYGYKTDGIIPEGQQGPGFSLDKPLGEGQIKYCDINGDGFLSDLDKTIVGNPNPDFIYGLSTSFSWKGLSISASIDGSYGNDIVNANLIQETKTVYNTSSYSNIRREAFTQAWTLENQNTKYPRLDGMTVEELKLMTDRWVEDASYLRLSSVSLSYRLPVPKNKVIRDITLGVSGRNLYVFSKYSGWDPEVSSYGNSMERIGVDLGSYPTARTYSFDLKFTF
jgi:TonB-linked SusC/RagA family outer membrane protein